MKLIHNETGEIIDAVVLVEGENGMVEVPVAERYHPDFVAQLVPYDPANPPVPAPAPSPPVPAVVTMRQARLALLANGTLGMVSAAINALPSPQKEAAQIEWEYAAVVARGSALTATLGIALGLDDEALDALFAAAALL